MTHPCKSIATAAAQLRDRETTSRELVDRCLAQIARLEERVLAWVLVDETGARRAAEELDEAAARGEFRGPLHGIPIAIKDIVDVQGFPTLAGSRIREPIPAERDATIVARLRQAGAIILGKTVTTEFASFDPPPTRNPWNLERTPGGSSSGSAAAVASGMCLGAIGSQTGGSITRPASFCGVAGCKPTYGRVGLTGIVPLAWHMDHPGPIARSVNDLAILLQVIAGHDSADPLSSTSPVDRYSCEPAEQRPPRLGVLGGFFVEEAEPAVRTATQSALDTLRRQGCELTLTTLSSNMPEVLVRHRCVMAVDAAEYHRPHFPSRRSEYGAWIAKLLDEGVNCSAVDYAAALRGQIDFRQQVLAALDGFDALILPATTTTAPSRESTGNPAFNSPWSYSGLPTVSFPCGLAADGMPVSLQFVGATFGEAALLSFAAWCERVIGFDARPPID